MMRKWIHLILILMGCSMMGCTDETAREQEWIDRTVQEKLDDFTSKKKIECRESLIQRVLRAADSIILLESRFDVPDSLKVPQKKNRPNAPEVQFPKYQKPKVIGDSISRSN